MRVEKRFVALVTIFAVLFIGFVWDATLNLQKYQTPIIVLWLVALTLLAVKSFVSRPVILDDLSDQPPLYNGSGKLQPSKDALELEVSAALNPVQAQQAQMSSSTEVTTQTKPAATSSTGQQSLAAQIADYILSRVQEGFSLKDITETLNQSQNPELVAGIINFLVADGSLKVELPPMYHSQILAQPEEEGGVEEELKPTKIKVTKRTKRKVR
jgi:hypothetical protein